MGKLKLDWGDLTGVGPLVIGFHASLAQLTQVLSWAPGEARKQVQRLQGR